VTHRSKNYLAAAKGQACVFCGARDGTVVGAHLTGLRAQEFGKGKGVKPHDICIADLCSKCHHAFDTYAVGSAPADNDFVKKIDHSEQFLTCILRTIVRRIGQGVLKT